MEDALVQMAAAVIAVVAAAISAYVIPYIKSNVKREQLGQARLMARLVVYSVEQMAASGVLDLPKRDAAVGRLSDLLKERGVNISNETINDLIEQAVAEMKLMGEELVQGEDGKSVQKRIEF